MEETTKVLVAYAGREFGSGKKISHVYHEMVDGRAINKLTFDRKLSPMHEVGGLFEITRVGENRYSRSDKRSLSDKAVGWYQDKESVAAWIREDIDVGITVKVDSMKAKVSPALKSLAQLKYIYQHSSEYEKAKLLRLIVEELEGA